MDILIFFINFAFGIYYIVMLARIILSWFPHSENPWWTRFIYLLTEPFLNIIRRGVPPASIGIDASPAVAIILLWILQKVLINFVQSML